MSKPSKKQSHRQGRMGVETTPAPLRCSGGKASEVREQATATTSNTARSGASFEGVALIAVLAGLVFFQGGYYKEQSCIAGIVTLVCIAASIVIRLKNKTLPSWQQLKARLLVPVLFVCVGIFGLVSAAINGFFSTNAPEALPWIAVGTAGFLAAFISAEQRKWILLALAWAGAATGVLGVIAMTGIVPVEGLVHDERLFFTFQYANAAGIWFAVLLVILWTRSSTPGNSWLQMLAIFPFAALLLTRSTGSLIVFGLALVVLAVTWLRSGNMQKIVLVAVQSIGAVFVLAVGRFAGYEWVFVATLALFICQILGFSAIENLPESGRTTNKLAIVLLALLAVVLVGVIAFIAGRSEEISYTLWERFQQMGDALTLLLLSPVIGVGPDRWMDLYPLVQSFPYVANSVHCSYLQIALDSGLLGLACFMAALTIGLVRAISKRDLPLVLCIAMMALHCAFDFDLEFAALSLLLELMLVLPVKEQTR